MSANGHSPVSGSTVSAADTSAAAIPPVPARRPARSGTAEAVVAQAAEAYPDHAGVARLAGRLSRGINTKSGSCLSDVHALAQLLFVELGDPAAAMSVCQLVTELPYDGNPGRWNGIEGCLALASYIAADNGEERLAADYAHKLRAPDRESADDFRSKITAQVRQRSLNEPNLYDREISRSAAAVDRKKELEWRKLRLQILLFLLAHGGSETYEDDELARLAGNELADIRTLTSASR